MEEAAALMTIGTAGLGRAVVDVDFLSRTFRRIEGVDIRHWRGRSGLVRALVILGRRLGFRRLVSERRCSFRLWARRCNIRRSTDYSILGSLVTSHLTTRIGLFRTLDFIGVPTILAGFAFV